MKKKERKRKKKKKNDKKLRDYRIRKNNATTY